MIYKACLTALFFWIPAAMISLESMTLWQIQSVWRDRSEIEAESRLASAR